jgi:F-box protein 18 (helicase)
MNKYFSSEPKSPRKVYGSPVKKVAGSDHIYTMTSSASTSTSSTTSSQLVAERTIHTPPENGSSASQQAARQKTAKSSTFGLLGDAIDLTESDDESGDYFSSMPEEVLQNILCQLPLSDLCLNAALVCRRWYDIISNEKVVMILSLFFASCTWFYCYSLL